MFNNYLIKFRKKTKEIYLDNKLSSEKKDLLMIKNDWDMIGNDLKSVLKNNFNSQK